MRVRPALLLALCLSSTAVFAAEPPRSFPGLTSLDLKDEGVRVWLPPNATMKIDAPKWLAEVRDAGVYIAMPARFAMGHGLPPLTLVCDSGPSNDPSCRLLRDANDAESVVFESPGTEFAFLASGEILSFGATDYFYDHRRLFRFDGKKFAEVAQPFRYVGVEGRLSAPLAITQSRTPAASTTPPTPIATLAAGTTIAILLNATDGDDDNGQNADYLVRTPDGLVGWARIASKPDGTTIVDGFRYNGD